MIDAGGARPRTDMTPADLDALVERFPEIHPGNYGEDDAIALNNWGIEAVAAITELRDENARLDADHNRIGAKCDALQQKVGRMRRALRQLNKAHRVLVWLLQRARAIINRWQELYGDHQPQFLPPAHQIEWAEDASEFIDAARGKP